MRTAPSTLVLILVLGLAASVAEAGTAKQRCAPAANAQGEVIGIMRQMFAAARTDDLPALLALTAPDFYAYDGGKRFTAQTLMDFIKKLHAAGKHYEWNVTNPEAHIACTMAWVTYVNQGSIEDAGGRQDMSWLESAVLEYGNGQWRMRFFHSTRVPVTP